MFYQDVISPVGNSLRGVTVRKIARNSGGDGQEKGRSSAAASRDYPLDNAFILMPSVIDMARNSPDSLVAYKFLDQSSSDAS